MTIFSLGRPVIIAAGYRGVQPAQGRISSGIGTFIFAFFVGTVKNVWASGDWRGLLSWQVLSSLGPFVFSFFIPKIIERIKAFRRSQAG